MIPYYVFEERAPGIAEIVRTGACDPAQRNIQAELGQNVETGLADAERQYVLLDANYTPTVVDKPAMPTDMPKNEVQANGEEIALVHSIPEGARVELLDTIGQLLFDDVVNDGTFEMQFERPGHYVVRISCFPYAQRLHHVYAV